MLKIFLVEDEAVIREGLRDKIPWEQYGYQFVGEAADGEIALPLIRKVKPDVLITDIKMPFMDGLSLSKIVSGEFPQIKIIIISGHDDFKYAKKAIEVGVDQYLLKPITRANLREILMELKEKIENEMNKGDYQTRYANEMHEYEQFTRRRFFEKVFEGEMSLADIFEEASKRSLDISASAYNLMFLYLQEKNSSLGSERVEMFILKQEEIIHYFLRHPQYILFRWDVNCFGILIKSDVQEVENITNKALRHIEHICIPEEEHMDWYVAVGNSVERISLLPDCYHHANQYFAYRFIIPSMHVLSEETLSSHLNIQEKSSIAGIDHSRISSEIIKDFLSKGRSNEIHDFVESSLRSIQEALKSRMFRDYVVLNIRFTILSFIESLGAVKEEYDSELNKSVSDLHLEAEEVYGYFVDSLKIAFLIRDKESSYQSGKALRRALEYIDNNFALESLTLGTIASEAGVSPNYLSSIFSQSMQKTFTEYVTEKRMEKAKKLLRTTSLPFGEIAAKIGYKDSHYFSFVFKKMQGCSPREYRSSK